MFGSNKQLSSEIPNYASDDRRTNIAAIKSSSHGLLAAIIVLSLIGVSSIVALAIVNPEKDNSGLVALILGFLTPTILALIAFMVKDVHNSVNGRLEELLNITAKASKAQGRLEGSPKG